MGFYYHKMLWDFIAIFSLGHIVLKMPQPLVLCKHCGTRLSVIMHPDRLFDLDWLEGRYSEIGCDISYTSNILLLQFLNIGPIIQHE